MITNSIIGKPPNNKMRNTKGLDEIDIWAAGLGQSERNKKELTPENIQSRKKGNRKF